MGTWEMPLKIPPAKLNLTSRSAAAASRLTNWIHKSTALTSACNGLRPQITGKVGSPGCRGRTFLQGAGGTRHLFAEVWVELLQSRIVAAGEPACGPQWALGNCKCI